MFHHQNAMQDTVWSAISSCKGEEKEFEIMTFQLGYDIDQSWWCLSFNSKNGVCKGNHTVSSLIWN